MTCNLKALGLAVLAVLAMGATAAATASAESVTLTPAGYPATITGTVHPITGATNHFFESSSGVKVECKHVTFDATIKEKGDGDTDVTVAPTYKECTAGGNPATVKMTDCDYTFHNGETDGAGGFKNGQVDLVCPGTTTGPDIVVYADEAHTESICTLTMWNFTNKTGNTFVNVAGSPNDVTMTTNLTGINVTRTGSVVCGKATQTTIYKGGTTLEAYEDPHVFEEGSKFGLTASTEKAPGLEEVTLTPGEYPATITGTVHPITGATNHYFETSGGFKFECEHVTFDATIAKKGSADTSVTVTPIYTGCTLGGNPMTINMTGCDYVFHNGETDGSGGFKNGTVDLVCPGTTTGPDISVYIDKAHTELLCTLTMWNFTNKTGNTFVNVAGSPNDVTMTTNLTGINVTRTGSVACGKATQTAIYKGGTTLEAYKDPKAGEEGSKIGLTVSHP